MTAALQHRGKRARQRSATRAAILVAAAEVFSARGFEGATLREIAVRAGVKQPLLVYHFGSKEQLWEAAVDRLWRRLVEAVRADSERVAGADSPELLRAVLRSFIAVVAAEPAWLQILLREAAEPGPRLDWLVEQHSRSTYALGAEFLAPLQAQGLLPPGSTRHLLYILVGALTFVLAIAPEVERVTGDRPRSEAFLDRHVDAFMSLFLADPPRGAART
jgi:AcrR family transcriptional regulator